MIEVEGGDSCGKSEIDETPQVAQADEEAWRSPAESVRLKRNHLYDSIKKSA